ncbi:hypothetical protein EVAR_3669_1 [Eumeta japonica]|uniref:Uncharacterized protein n=1 Tax=Eumeta variegata TaxID=151549 RepID=A0A4C1SRY9_EUMVA|nr:hypothetical protein EVAR_3669_1 [Eumeta japonica]
MVIERGRYEFAPAFSLRYSKRRRARVTLKWHKQNWPHGISINKSGINNCMAMSTQVLYRIGIGETSLGEVNILQWFNVKMEMTRFNSRYSLYEA